MLYRYVVILITGESVYVDAFSYIVDENNTLHFFYQENDEPFTSFHGDRWIQVRRLAR